MLDAFFDGSGSSATSTDSWLVLAAVSGAEEACEIVRTHWKSLLDRFCVPSLHMREAVAKSSVEGGGREQCEALVQGAIGILTETTFAHPNRRLLATFHAVNLDDFWDLKRVDPGVTTEPEELLALYSLTDLFELHIEVNRIARTGEELSPSPGIKLTFDRGEGFQGHLVSDWRNRKHRRHHRRWKLIEAIDEADSAEEPMLQAADLLAWSARRSLAGDNCDWPGDLAHDAVGRPKISWRVFRADGLRTAARALSGQAERYRGAGQR